MQRPTPLIPRSSWRAGRRKAIRTALVISCISVFATAGYAGREVFDDPLDGVWVGILDASVSGSKRPYPVLLNLEARDSAGDGLILVADDLAGAPSRLDFVPLTLQVKGKKLTLTSVADGDARASRFVAVLRLKGDVLKGTLTASDQGFKKSRLELRRLDAEQPLQQLWTGTLPDARGASELIALTIWVNGAVSGGGFVGSAFGDLANATVVNGRFTGVLETGEGDIELDLTVDRDGQLGGLVGGRSLGGGPLAPGNTPVAPTIRKLKPSSLPGGVTTTMTIRGKNLAPGFLIHSNVEGVYAGLPQVQSARKATVELTVEATVATGTSIQLSTAAASGTVSASKAKLKTVGVAAVSFEDDLLPIFVGTCAVEGCHVKPPEDDPAYPEGGEAAGGMDLSRRLAYGNIVNKPSNGRPELDRIEPFDVERSYLIKKLRGDGDIVGVRMPENGPPYLSAAMIDMFIRWVKEGAPQN